jgi:hypothetical protein
MSIEDDIRASVSSVEPSSGPPAGLWDQIESDGTRRRARHTRRRHVVVVCGTVVLFVALGAVAVRVQKNRYDSLGYSGTNFVGAVMGPRARRPRRARRAGRLW